MWFFVADLKIPIPITTMHFWKKELNAPKKTNNLSIQTILVSQELGYFHFYDFLNV